MVVAPTQRAPIVSHGVGKTMSAASSTTILKLDEHVPRSPIVSQLEVCSRENRPGRAATITCSFSGASGLRRAMSSSASACAP